MIEGLYQLVNTITVPTASSYTHVASSAQTFQSSAQTFQSSVFLWHKRFGHVPFTVLSRIKDLDIKHSSLLKSETVSPCDVCPLAKQCKLSFPISTSHASLPFDLVHCDLWGPYRVPTCNGCKYFLTIVDDCTRGVWTILLPTKQHAIQSLKDFLVTVTTQFHTSVKCLRSDNGGEFMNHDLCQFLNSQGIIHQTSCPSTPQQNGRVERKQRNLLEMTRALMFQANLPTKFWGDCLLTSTYIINRIPTSVLGFVSPYELLFHEPSDCNNLRVLGCLAYMSVHSPDKLAPRAVKTIFLGYPPHQKGYKLFDHLTNSFHVSRHVIFHENVFPYKDINNYVLYPSSTSVFCQPDLSSFDTPLDQIFHDSIPNYSSTYIIIDSSPTIPEQVSSPGFSTDNEPSQNSVNNEQSQDSYADNNISASIENSDSSDISTTLPTISRISLRHKVQRTWMKNYVVSKTNNKSLSSILPQAHNVLLNCPIDASKYSFQHYSLQNPQNPVFACSVSPQSTYKEPYNYNQAATDPRWVEAMQKELHALESNHTWEIVSLSQDKKIV